MALASWTSQRLSPATFLWSLLDAVASPGQLSEGYRKVRALPRPRARLQRLQTSGDISYRGRCFKIAVGVRVTLGQRDGDFGALP